MKIEHVQAGPFEKDGYILQFTRHYLDMSQSEDWITALAIFRRSGEPGERSAEPLLHSCRD